jgi:hypothetical protein
MQHLGQFLFHQRGFWLRLEMSELSELYTAMMLKTFGLSLIGIFVPIYLYEQGWSIGRVVLFMAVNYAIRALASRPLSRLVRRAGAKNLMRTGLGLTVGFLAMLITLPQIDWPLWLLAVVDGPAITMFYLGYHIDFSQAKKLEEFGSEAERVFATSKLAAAAAPFIGGVIATVFNPQATIAVALAAIALAAWPLSRGPAAVPLPAGSGRWRWDFKRYRRSYLSFAALGLDQTASVVYWPFFAALFIFSGEIYLQLGLVTSVSAISTILVVHALGKLVDNHRGGLLMTYSALLGGGLHLIRSLATGLPQVLGINILSEWFMAGSHMPYLKGMYDEADHAADRAAYIGAMETAINLGRLVLWGLIGLALVASQSDETGFRLAFVAAAWLTPLILRHRFAVLRAEARA